MEKKIALCRINIYKLFLRLFWSMFPIDDKRKNKFVSIQFLLCPCHYHLLVEFGVS